ncbi:MAG: protein phosphatase 2C domain-containing protein, partial [Armatimonadetes bacterium]|nr:protein phosphatase 2C domain-containing protein [Armatimonadota bacterium]
CSDGLGSRSGARVGARAAVRAASRAWRSWSKAVAPDPSDFVRLLEVLWRLDLAATAAADACATLLFVGVRLDGSGLCAQLGDGLIAERANDAVRCLTPERTSYASVTTALGAPHGLADWLLTPLEPVAPGTVFLLATDGVADDLVPERLSDLVSWLLAEFGDPPGGGARLRKALNQWPVPRHLDDKSIVLLWNQARS